MGSPQVVAGAVRSIPVGISGVAAGAELARLAPAVAEAFSAQAGEHRCTPSGVPRAPDSSAVAASPPVVLLARGHGLAGVKRWFVALLMAGGLSAQTLDDVRNELRSLLQGGALPGVPRRIARLDRGARRCPGRRSRSTNPAARTRRCTCWSIPCRSPWTFGRAGRGFGCSVRSVTRAHASTLRTCSMAPAPRRWRPACGAATRPTAYCRRGSRTAGRRADGDADGDRRPVARRESRLLPGHRAGGGAAGRHPVQLGRDLRGLRRGAASRARGLALARGAVPSRGSLRFPPRRSDPVRRRDPGRYRNRSGSSAGSRPTGRCRGDWASGTALARVARLQALLRRHRRRARLRRLLRDRSRPDVGLSRCAAAARRDRRRRRRVDRRRRARLHGRRRRPVLTGAPSFPPRAASRERADGQVASRAVLLAASFGRLRGRLRHRPGRRCALERRRDVHLHAHLAHGRFHGHVRGHLGGRRDDHAVLARQRLGPVELAVADLHAGHHLGGGCGLVGVCALGDRHGRAGVLRDGAGELGLEGRVVCLDQRHVGLLQQRHVAAGGVDLELPGLADRDRLLGAPAERGLGELLDAGHVDAVVDLALRGRLDLTDDAAVGADAGDELDAGAGRQPPRQLAHVDAHHVVLELRVRRSGVERLLAEHRQRQRAVHAQHLQLDRAHALVVDPAHCDAERPGDAHRLHLLAGHVDGLHVGACLLDEVDGRAGAGVRAEVEDPLRGGGAGQRQQGENGEGESVHVATIVTIRRRNRHAVGRIMARNRNLDAPDCSAGGAGAQGPARAACGAAARRRPTCARSAAPSCRTDARRRRGG